ncbi:MAG TPA: hypothetical protein VIJ16_10610 [Gemmatimonadaceae bacterium]
MTTSQGQHSSTTAPALSIGKALAFATLTIGILDIADALIFYGLRGVAPHLIFQSIASGLLGHPAFTGGFRTALLGGALHFFISFVIALVYLVANGRIATLADRPFIWGPLYGIAVWAVMYFAVLPLSAAAPSPMKWPVVTDEIAIHIFGVGLPAALFAAAAQRRRV